MTWWLGGLTDHGLGRANLIAQVMLLVVARVVKATYGGLHLVGGIGATVLSLPPGIFSGKTLDPGLLDRMMVVLWLCSAPRFLLGALSRR